MGRSPGAGSGLENVEGKMKSGELDQVNRGRSQDIGNTLGSGHR